MKITDEQYATVFGRFPNFWLATKESMAHLYAAVTVAAFEKRSRAARKGWEKRRGKP